MLVYLADITPCDAIPEERTFGIVDAVSDVVDHLVVALLPAVEAYMVLR